MDTKNLLKKYYSRLAKESFIKALMFGLVVGFSILLISSAIWWFVGLKSFWLCIIFFVVATAGATLILYYKVFRPTIKQTAKRVDALGLEERLLTMTELERETSFIAIRQREDATGALKTVNEKLIKFAVSTSLVVALAIITVFGVGMSTVAGLSANGVLKSGRDLFFKTTGSKQFEITYVIQGEGEIKGENLQVIEKTQTAEGKTIEGKIFQVVDKGQDAAAVMAVPEDEWVFAGWLDGYGNPYRVDTEISKDMTVYVVFEKMDGLTDEDIDFGDEGQGSGQGQPGGDPGDTGDPAETDETGDGDDEGGGAYANNNQVFNGKTYYGGSVYENAYNDMTEGISGNNSSEEGKDIIEDYFNTIKK